MIATAEQIRAKQNRGERVRGVDGAPLPPLPKPAASRPPPEPSTSSRDIQALTTAIRQLVDKPAPAPQVTVHPPDVTVQAPSNFHQFKTFELEVTEHDKSPERRIKKIVIRGIE